MMTFFQKENINFRNKKKYLLHSTSKPMMFLSIKTYLIYFSGVKPFHKLCQDLINLKCQNFGKVHKKFI